MLSIPVDANLSPMGPYPALLRWLKSERHDASVHATCPPEEPSFRSNPHSRPRSGSVQTSVFGMLSQRR